jgi:hypothetical protein
MMFPILTSVSLAHRIVAFLRGSRIRRGCERDRQSNNELSRCHRFLPRVGDRAMRSRRFEHHSAFPAAEP